MSPDVSNIPTCERTINQIGWGLYHQFMIGITAACAFSQATALMSMPFAIPLAICDMSISEKMIPNIDAFFALGTAFGGFFITSASDVTGRKCITAVSLMIIFGSTFACGFAHGYTMIIICVFCLGCGIASNASCIKIHLAEILPSEKRGCYLVFPDIFWTVGYIISAVAWLLTPSILYHQNRDVRFTTWRLIFGLSGACSIMVACASALIQPSPRFLLFSKRYPEALDTLKHMYAVNNSRHSETCSLHQEDLFGCIDDFSLNNQQEPTTCTDQMVSSFRRLQKLISQLLKQRFLRVTILLIFIKLTFTFGILMMNIWLAKMLRDSDKNNCFFTATDILHLENNSNKCKFDLRTSLYRDFFLIALNIIIGQILLLFLVDRVGRRISIVGGCIACGASSFALGYIHNTYSVKLAASFVFMMAYSLVDSALNIVVIEAYPTAFRGTAAGGTQFFARFASVFVNKFLQTPCQYSFIFIGALMLAAAVLSCFLPELRGQAMVE